MLVKTRLRSELIAKLVEANESIRPSKHILP